MIKKENLYWHILSWQFKTWGNKKWTSQRNSTKKIIILREKNFIKICEGMSRATGYVRGICENNPIINEIQLI